MVPAMSSRRLAARASTTPYRGNGVSIFSFLKIEAFRAFAVSIWQ